MIRTFRRKGKEKRYPHLDNFVCMHTQLFDV